MSEKRGLKGAVEYMRELQQAGTAWAARQAVGDAVLLLLRDSQGAVTRDALRAQLLRMAQGKVAEWHGISGAAEKAAEFIDAPPPHLPEMATERK